MSEAGSPSSSAICCELSVACCLGRGGFPVLLYGRGERTDVQPNFCRIQRLQGPREVRDARCPGLLGHQGLRIGPAGLVAIPWDALLGRSGCTAAITVALLRCPKATQIKGALPGRPPVC